LPGVGNGRFCHTPQRFIYGHSDAPPGTPVKDFPLCDCLPGHFFQAEGLGAELDVVIVPFSLFAMFVDDDTFTLAETIQI